MDLTNVMDSWTTTSEDMVTKHFPIHRACRDGDIQHLSSLLSTGEVDLYEEDDFYGWTPIHWSAYFGKLSCLMLLLEHGGNWDSSTERLNQSPAHIAAYGGQSHCLKWLLHCGALMNRQDYMGETPTHKAARTGSMECVSLLVSQGANLNMRNYSGCTPSQVAMTAGYTDCANYLERANQIQCQAAGVYDEMRTPVTHPNCNGTNQMVNPLNTERGSPEGQSTAHNQFISTNTYHSNPHVITNGTVHVSNGTVQNNNNNQSDDCDMEMEDGAHCGESWAKANVCNGAVHEVPNGDVLLCDGVSRNVVPLAGKKRGREELIEESYKRARNDEPPIKYKLNGWFFNNGHMTSQLTDHMTQDSDSMVEHKTSISMQQGYDSMVLDSVMDGNCGSQDIFM